MAPVGLHRVVSCTSEDSEHRASNVLKSLNIKTQWLSNPQDHQGQMEAIFQMGKSCRISFINIGTHWCAEVEVQVGRSQWPLGMTYRTLVPTTVIMQPASCKTGRSVSSVKMFASKDFTEAGKEEWDRIKIICRQPHRKEVQFGLSFLHISEFNGAKANPSARRTSLASGNISCDLERPKRPFLSMSGSYENCSEGLKSKLLKLAGVAENGSVQEEPLTRTERLLLAAKAKTSRRFNPEHRAVSMMLTTPKRLLSEHLLAKRRERTLEEEITGFLQALDTASIDLDTFTIAEARYKFEEKTLRKLALKEKKTFRILCEEFFCNMYSNNSPTKAQSSPTPQLSSHNLFYSDWKSFTGLSPGNKRPSKSPIASTSWANVNLSPRPSTSGILLPRDSGSRRNLFGSPSRKEQNTKSSLQKSDADSSNPVNGEGKGHADRAMKDVCLDRLSREFQDFSDNLIEEMEKLNTPKKSVENHPRSQIKGNSKPAPHKGKRPSKISLQKFWNEYYICCKCEEGIHRDAFPLHYSICVGKPDDAQDGVIFPKVEDFVPCPLCGLSFAEEVIQVHANDCNG